MNMHAADATSAFPPGRSILGISVASIGWDEAIGAAEPLAGRTALHQGQLPQRAQRQRRLSVDPAFAEALDDFLILPDGVGVDMAAKILYGAPFPANLNGTDFIPAFLQAAAKPLTVGLLGATRANAEAAAAEAGSDRAAAQLRRDP